MKKTITTWWPVAIVLPLALMFFMHTGEGAPAFKHREVATVSGVSAEFARALSYGLVDDDAMPPASVVTSKTL